MIRVRLIASSPALRAGLRSLLAAEAEIHIVGEDNAWRTSGDRISDADVVITTSASAVLGGPTSAMEAAVLFLQDEPIGSPSLMQAAGVWGVLPLETSSGELCAAVRALSEGLIVGARALIFRSEENLARGPLTDREAEVLGWLAKGMANKQIALALGISEHTVKFHISSIYGKLNATSRTQAVREGLRNGWILL